MAAETVEHDGPGELPVPEEHSGLGGAGEEEVGVERVPDDLVDRSDVDLVGHEELGGELGGTKMNVTLLSPHQELAVQVRLEGDTPDTIDHRPLQVLHTGSGQKVGGH